MPFSLWQRWRLTLPPPRTGCGGRAVADRADAARVRHLFRELGRVGVRTVRRGSGGVGRGVRVSDGR